MKNILLLLILLAGTSVVVGQASRTAAAIQTAPYSQLTSTLPDATVRVCINCQANASTGVCESGASQMQATKLNSVWKCTKFDPSGGGGSGVTSFNGRVGAVIPTLGDYTFDKISNVAQGFLLGRGASSGTGAIQQITIGSGLTLTGTTLTASGGGGGTVTGSGTLGRIARWFSSSAIGDGTMDDTGSVVTVLGGASFIATGSVNVGTTLFVGSGGSNITSPLNGRFKFANLAGTGFSKLSFGSGSTEQRIEFGTGTGVGTGDFNFYAGGANAGALIEAGSFQTQVGDGNGLNLRAALGSVYVQAASGVGSYTPWVFSFPSTDGTSGQCLQTDGSGATSWAACGSSGANTALSNLASVAINSSLLAGTAGAVDVGSTSRPFGFLFFSGSSSSPNSNNFKLVGASTSGTRTIDAPDANTVLPIITQRLTITGPSSARSYAIADASTTVATAAAALTSTAIVTGGGAGLVQTPAATTTLDSSGNISTAGAGAFGVGGGVAGNVGLGQGTATAVAANTIQHQAPTSVTGYNFVYPSAAASGLLQWTNSANVLTGTFSALTSGRVTFATTNGLLSDDSDLTFATDTLTATKIVGSTSITDTGLTSGRVTLASTAGLLADDSDLTFATDTLTFTKGAATTSLTVAGAAVTNNLVQNSQSAAYSTVLADAGKSILHPSTDTNARTFTIDQTVSYPVGTCITFINMTANVVTIAISADTLYLAGTGTTGSRSLAQYGVATAYKIDATHWIISGSGLT